MPSSTLLPAEPAVYQPNVALEFFKTFGSVESARTEQIIFAHGQKANRLLLQHDKMYLLVAGKITIHTPANETVPIKAGEIFGELTPLIQLPRSASAIAEIPCKLLSLNEAQLMAGLRQKPEFALMFMAVMVKHLRHAISLAKQAKLFNSDKDGKVDSVFDSKMRQTLVNKLGEQAILQVPKQRIIFQEGGIGMLMYVILEGEVTTRIEGKIVEHCGAGCVIGEIALVDQKHRIAEVIADTNCSLLAINRQDFLMLVKSEPSFGIAVLKALATRLYGCYTGYSHAPLYSLFSGF